MRIKILNWLFIVDILTVLLILAIIFIPSSIARIVLGLPFLLLFPGYALIEALFARKGIHPLFNSPPSRGRREKKFLPSRERRINGEGEEAKISGGMDGIERVALSFGMSIAVTALIGLGLNYTPWGIRLEPVLYSISAFIIIMSFVALFRKGILHNNSLLFNEYNFKLPGWEGGTLNKTLTVILAVAIIGAVGTLIYTIAVPKVGERFTEFYILGNDGKAENYPSDFVLNSSQSSVISVQYGSSMPAIPGKYGRVTLGIVNHEQEKASYKVVLQIDGQPAEIIDEGIVSGEAGAVGSPIKGEAGTEEGLTVVLEQGEKWEHEIGFAPQHIGDNQKVEFFLYKDGASTPEDTLHLWVNVKGE